MHGEFQISWLQLFEHWRVYRREGGKSIGCIEGDGTQFTASVSLGEKLVPVAYGSSVHEVGMALAAGEQPENVRQIKAVS